MQFDDYGNVVEEPVKGIDSAQESRGKDRLTEKFLKMNEECISNYAHNRPKLVDLSKVDDDSTVVVNEQNWLEFQTCAVAMLHARDKICRFADDVLGFGDIKSNGTHTGGYAITHEIIDELLEFLANDHLEKQKKKNPKARKKKNATPARDVNGATIFCDFGTKVYHFRLWWTTLRVLMKWEKDGWLTSTCIDFLAELVNLSLGHAPNENVFPTSLMANSYTGMGLVPQHKDDDLAPLIKKSYSPEFEQNFVTCMRKIWFPKVKTSVKRSLFCYKAIDLPMPRMAFSINSVGNHWETIQVNSAMRHVESVDPYHGSHNANFDVTNLHRRWASKYFGMYQCIMDGNPSPYAGHKDMIRVWRRNDIEMKRSTLAAYIGTETSTFSHCDIDYDGRPDLPVQIDGRNCGIYSWHFAYCFLFGASCNPKFDPEQMRLRLVFLMIIVRTYVQREGGEGKRHFSQPESRQEKGKQRTVIDGLPEVLPWFIDHLRTKGRAQLADRLLQFSVSTEPLLFLFNPDHYEFVDKPYFDHLNSTHDPAIDGSVAVANAIPDPVAMSDEQRKQNKNAAILGIA